MMSYSIASCTIQLVTNENPVNSYLILTVDKTHHGTVIALLSVQLLQYFSYSAGFVVTNGRKICDNLVSHSNRNWKWLKQP